MISSVGQNYSAHANYAKQNNINFSGLFGGGAAKKAAQEAQELTAKTAQDTIGSLTKENGALKTSLNTLQESYNKVQEQLERAQESYKYVANRNGILEEANKGLKKEVEDLNGQLFQKGLDHKAEIEALEARIPKMEPIKDVVFPQDYSNAYGGFLGLHDAAINAFKAEVMNPKGAEGENFKFIKDYLNYSFILEKGSKQGTNGVQETKDLISAMPEAVSSKASRILYHDYGMWGLMKNAASTLGKDPMMKNSSYKRQMTDGSVLLLRNLNKNTPEGASKLWDTPGTRENIDTIFKNFLED
jgi:hypothetical protein